ncbi:MAG: hypothetical protein ABI417_13485 [Coleofasciculaceae cyanobacterium]
MSEPTPDPIIAYAVALLNHYKFELRGYTAPELVNLWLRNYQANWVRLGVIEALYQGRYKAVSVEQILAVWARRGEPVFRFTHEFERLISRKLPQRLTAKLGTTTDVFSELSLPWLTADSEVGDNTTDENRQISLTPEELASASSIFKASTEIPLANDQPPELSSNARINAGYEANWSRCEISKQPIDQFTPATDNSGFFLKLKAVAQQDLSPINLVTPVKKEEESKPSPSITT